MASQHMNQVINRLKSDWNFVEHFLGSPSEALKGYELTKEERRCLETRDATGLLGLGLTKDMIIQAMSGGHSQTCPAQPIVGA